MKLVFAIIFLCSTAAFAQTKPAQSEPVRIYQVDSVGNKQYHKPSFVVEGNKVYQTDTVGNKQNHKPSYSIQQDGKRK